MMKPYAMALASVLVLGISFAASAQLVNEEQVQSKLEQDGYTEVHDVKFGPEGINAMAEKDGREWSLVLDSGGKIIRREEK